MKCSTFHPNLEIDNYHMVCICRMWTIVDSHRGYTFEISMPESCTADQSACTCTVLLLAHIEYTNTIVFDCHSSFM